KSFLMLNRAKTVDDCREAIDSFVTPAQNFLCVDNRGQTGIFQMGRFPIRWKGQGRMILDGSTAIDEWAGWIPREENPMIRNPERGFLSSANQAPADKAYPHYLGWPFDEPFRGMRINELLKGKTKLSPQDLIAIQGDTVMIPARELRPVFLAALDKSNLASREAEAVKLLESWDGAFTEESAAAVIFETWLQAAVEDLWKERFPDKVNYLRPPLQVTMELMIQSPESKWFDSSTTPVKETFKDLVRGTLTPALDEIERETGSSDPDSWAWGRWRPTHAQHIGRLPGFDSVFKAPGHEFAIFANKGNHGPVWKLVVAVGPKPKAWAIYPGGQSGDPLSPHYDDFLDSWRRNDLKEIRYLDSASAENDRKKMTLILSAEGAK
ncbi:MAG: penicillin acylase family protein, partial [Bdellovibrionota bacterium]